MSGGSLDYVCYKVEEAADTIMVRATCFEHKTFAFLLKKIAKALHDLEWVFSLDYGPGDEMESLMAIISPNMLLDQSIKEAKQTLLDIQSAITRIEAQK